jgi:hypothetical protein
MSLLVCIRRNISRKPKWHKSPRTRSLNCTAQRTSNDRLQLKTPMSEIVEGCTMPALIHGAARIRQNPAGRRRTSPEGGNRGMLPRGPGNLNSYGDLMLRSWVWCADDADQPDGNVASVCMCAMLARIRRIFRQHLRQETTQFQQRAKPSPIGAG